MQTTNDQSDDDVDISIFEQKVWKGPRCTVGQLIKRMEADGQTERIAQLRKAMATTHVTAGRIRDVLHEWGHTDMGHWAIQRHRRRECQCP